jgi:fucose 4-O-acetylase-like acetyltransferase
VSVTPGRPSGGDDLVTDAATQRVHRDRALDDAVAGATGSHPRDRFLDLLRGGSIVAVVVGHWLVDDLYWSGGAVRHRSALGEAPALWPLTWVFQVIPLFFFVGGYANRRSWLGVTERGEGYAAFVDRRMHRLLAPTAVLLLAVIAGNAVQALLEAYGKSPGLGSGGAILLQPLWFLGIYVMVTALTPVTLRWHERWGWRVVVVALALVGAVDVLRLAGGLSWVAFANVLVVWGLVHQLGYLYADKALGTRQSMLLAVLGGGALVLLTAGPYPARMVGVPGDELVNMNPPTAALTALAVAQVGVAVLARHVLNRWLRRPRVWTVVVALNLSIMSIYLWHQPVMAVMARLLAPSGLPHPDPPGLSWWGIRLVWFAAAGLLLAAAVLLVGRFERGAPPGAAPRRRPATIAAVTSVVLAELGLLGVAGTDAGSPFAVSRVLAEIDVAPVVAMVCVGVAMLLLWGARRGDRAARGSLLAGAAAFLPVGCAYAMGVGGLTPSTRLLGLVGVLSLGLLAAAVAATGSGHTDRADGRGG